MRVEHLYKKGTHSWIVMGRDEERQGDEADTNQYLIEHNGRGLLLDPGAGGVENFSVVAAELSKHFDLADVEAIFISHQDPDVISSLSLWIQINPKLLVYVSELWVDFIAHVGVKAENIRPIPDEGGIITLGGHDLELIPAHYLHSAGNLSVYDPLAKILFSGDIGTALLPSDFTDRFVTNFDGHTKTMEHFHRRWMPSNTAKSRWIAQVRKCEVDMLCPQHGAIFKDDDVERFLTWFENLDVGSGWSSVR